MVDFKNLKVWHRAVDFGVEVYKILRDFPKEEMFALSSQIRRAVISIFSNIAEGYRCGTTGEFIYFLNKARGSCAEVEAQLIFSEKVGYIDNKKVKMLLIECDEISRMLSGYINYLKGNGKNIKIKKDGKQDA